MTKKLLFFVGCFLVVALFPISVWASQTTRTLQPGRTYEFVGRDARVISHVNISGAGRYQFVETNALGELLRFGYSNWRISISGTGRTAVTPLAPMQVTFDSSRLRVYESEGTVLRQFTVNEGQTISLQNTSMVNHHIRINLAFGVTYDFTLTDIFGDIDNFGFESRFPQVNVIGGGTKKITAQDGSLIVYFPSSWYGNNIRVARPQQPVLSTLEISAGYELALANSSSEAVNITARTMHIGIPFRYEFVMRGRDGHVVSYGTASSSQIRIPAHNTLHLTPIIDAELIFPHALLSYLSIGHGGSAPMYRSLLQGSSLVVTNNDPLRTHSIFVRCGTDSGNFSFDYVLENNNVITFRILENITAAQHVFNLPAGASITITATEAVGHLALVLPDISVIETRTMEQAALVRYEVLPGASVYITNDSGYTMDIMTITDENAFGFDIVRYDLESGDIQDFGRVDLRNRFSLDSGQSALITTHDYSVIFALPQIVASRGLTFVESDRVALFRQPLAYGNVLQIDNIDRWYNHYFLVEDDSNRRSRPSGFAYEYLATGIRARGGLLYYGLSNLGYHTIPTNGRVTLMPRPGNVLSVAFPSEWHGRYLQVRTVVERPLHHIVLTPGQSITINNSTMENFVLSNNSHATLAGFHIRVGHGLPVNLNTDIAQSGNIILTRGTVTTITAALGADLEIWMPLSLARQLRLV